MPDPASWGAAAAWAAGLLAPVFLLLFVALRLRRKARYPHEMLSPSQKAAPADFLPHSFRLYYDAFLDGLCALAIAAAMAGLPPPPDLGSAVVIDCSRSMLAGVLGDRPLDLACRDALSEAYEGADLFALGLDPDGGKDSLRRVPARARRDSSPDALARWLESSLYFSGADYGLLSSLASRGYSRITLLTDELGPEAVGFAAVEYGFRERAALYPASSAWDGEESVTRWASAGGALPAAIRSVDGYGRLFPLPPDRWRMESVPGGFRIRLREPGDYVVEWHGGMMPWRSAGPPPALTASGPLSEAAKSALDGLAAGGATAPGSSFGLVDGGGRSRSGRLSLARAQSEPYVLDPATTLGAAVAAGYSPDADLSLGHAGLASGEAAIACLSQIGRALAASRPSGGSRPLAPLGEGFRQAEGAAPVLPPPDEYWRPAAGGELALGGSAPPRWPTALALAALYCLKLYLSRKFGKGAAARPS